MFPAKPVLLSHGIEISSFTNSEISQNSRNFTSFKTASFKVRKTQCCILPSDAIIQDSRFFVRILSTEFTIIVPEHVRGVL